MLWTRAYSSLPGSKTVTDDIVSLLGPRLQISSKVLGWGCRKDPARASRGSTILMGMQKDPVRASRGSTNLLKPRLWVSQRTQRSQVANGSPRKLTRAEWGPASHRVTLADGMVNLISELPSSITKSASRSPLNSFLNSLSAWS